MPTISPALDLGIQTLGNAIQLTPASPAVGILSTSRNILQMINADKCRNLDEQRLALKVLEIAVAYSDGMKKLNESATRDLEIDRISNGLFGCLDSISRALRCKTKAGFFARLLSQSATQRKIKVLQTDMEHISSLFDAQIILRTAKLSQAISAETDPNITEGAMEKRIQQANEEALDLIKSQVLKQTRLKLHKSSFGHFPPAASPIFFGRSQQVEQLVESLVQVPAYHAILGPGGIGKTSVGLNVLHDPRVVEVYGKHRYFLACETTLDANGIIAGLADIFSLNEGSFFKLFKRLCGVIKSNILFLLDNLETPWERKESRQKVEDLLTDLSGIPNLSIIITLRGAERPGGILWSRPFLPILGPIDLAAARQTFWAISDIRDSNDDMDTLLSSVEFIPLAITLLAAQAPYTSCAFLLEQWKINKTSMITRGWDSRLTSLDVSISVSLTSSRFVSNPQALSLLQVLSLLPNGATVEELCNMVPGDVNVHKSVSTLLQVALANIDLRGRVRALAPIREYVESKHPISRALLQSVFSYHAELSRYARSSQWTVERTNMENKLNTCISNIHYVIRSSLDAEPFTNAAIEATIDVATFCQSSYSGSISHLLEESAKIARTLQQPLLLAACLHEAGVRMAYSPRDRTSALGCLEESANILRQSSSPKSCNLLISTLCNLAWAMDLLERTKEAAQFAREAVSLITPSTSPATCALAYMRVADILMGTGNNHCECQKALERAGSYMHSNPSPILGLKLSLHLCQLYGHRDLYGQSITAADLGLSLDITQDVQRAHLLVIRGNIYIHLNRYDDARRDLREAIQCLMSLGSAAHMTTAYRLLGLSYLACSEFTDAALSFHTALQFQSSDFGAIIQWHTIMGLATLELYRNHLDQSLIYLNSASKEILLCPVVSIAHLFWHQVRFQVQIRQKNSMSALSSCISAAIIAHGIQDRSEIAISILLLGDAFFFVEKDVTTSKACYQTFLDLMRYMGNSRAIANVLLRLGVTDYIQGDTSLARRRLKQAARIYQDTTGKAWAEFCQQILRLIDASIDHENIPFFPPIISEGF